MRVPGGSCTRKGGACLAQAVKETITVEGHDLVISNPDKLMFPEAGITKLDYLRHLLELAPYLLKYCRNRYLTTIRYPNGIHGKHFYQKNCPQPAPDFVRTATLNGIRYVVLDSVPTLLWLGNLACLEFHPSFHYVGEDLPAEWVIDIDPSLERDDRVMHAAVLVGELLESLRIQSVPKTSGATGTQIFVPIRRGYTFEQLRAVGKFLCEYLVHQHPRLFTLERLKKDRGTRIYLDYLQHWHGKTLSAPYTPRARKEATVSTPLTWDELRSGAKPEHFTLTTIGKRLNTYGDLIDRVPPQSLDHVLSHLGRNEMRLLNR